MDVRQTVLLLQLVHEIVTLVRNFFLPREKDSAEPRFLRRYALIALSSRQRQVAGVITFLDLLLELCNKKRVGLKD